MEENNKIVPENSIEIHSEEVEEILGKTPSGILRWGVTVLLIVIVGVIIGSWFFKYPDIIIAQISITTENVPAQLTAKANGKITSLLVADNENVKKDQVLAIIENPANYNEVLKIKSFIDKFNSNSLKESPDLAIYDTIIFSTDLTLGDIQSAFTDFVRALANYKNFIDLNLQQKKIEALNEQMQLTKGYYAQSSSQNDLLQNDLGLIKKQYSRDSSLLKNNFISESDFEKSKSSLIQKEYTYRSAITSLWQTRIQISQLEQNVLDLELQYLDQKKQFEDALCQTKNSLVNQIHTWEQNYLLVAPIPGKVSFTKIWAVNQNVTVGEKVLTIIPTTPSRMLGKVNLPLMGSGKVKIGQKVNIKLDNFPYQEYGMVLGTVQSKSLIAGEANNTKEYSVEILLPDKLKTNYGKNLDFSQDMTGTAEIMTDDLRLLERFFNPLKSIWKKHF